MTMIRAALRSDLDELAVLFDGYRQFYRQDPDLVACQRFLSERFDAGDALLLVAEIDESSMEGSRLAGFVQLFPSLSSVRLRRVLILNDLFVSADARRRGVGMALMAAAESLAYESGVGLLTLETEENNKSAQALYEARGWKRDTERHYSFVPRSAP